MTNCKRCNHDIIKHSLETSRGAEEDGVIDGMVDGECTVEGCECKDFVWW